MAKPGVSGIRDGPSPDSGVVAGLSSVKMYSVAVVTGEITVIVGRSAKRGLILKSDPDIAVVVYIGTVGGFHPALRNTLAVILTGEDSENVGAAGFPGSE